MEGAMAAGARGGGRKLDDSPLVTAPIPVEALPFLARHGWAGAEVRPLAGDASFRRYFRVNGARGTAVLMDSPPDLEDPRPFVAVAEFLCAQGFSAPRLLAGELERGLLLIEDFGDALVGPLLTRRPQLEADIYAAAIDLLADLQRRPVPNGLAPYDREEIAREVLVFADWYAAAAGIAVDRDAYLAAWDASWGEVLAETAARPVLTLRDYHVDNLMLLEGRAGTARLGLLDFQDALAGHPAYDLVSLLQDARRLVSSELEEAMLRRFVAAAGIPDAASFRARYEALGAQRNVKILGVFVRLRDRDGRQGYVERLPLVWQYLERNFSHPALAPVKSWFDAHVPGDRRAAWCS
jgi:aminoglycoside/choline kinase family phosphotransferase